MPRRLCRARVLRLRAQTRRHSKGGFVMSQTDSIVPQDEIMRVKGLGFLRDKSTPDRFNGRVITRNGKITARECAAVAQAAQRFGSGEVTLTTRMTMEIQGVPFENIEPLREFLRREAGLETGGTGAKVRPVVSCKGTTCQYGLIDTFSLSGEIHTRFYEGYRGVTLPHKFKIAVGGCPNNCVKPDLNDVGIVGQRIPAIHTEQCRGCNLCVAECPIHVISMEDDKAVIDAERCNHCGLCIGKCPFQAIQEQAVGYKVYLGGRWGKRTAMGRPLDTVFTSREDVLNLIEKCLLLFRAYGRPRERFADTIARLGFQQVQDLLMSDELLRRKEEILARE